MTQLTLLGERTDMRKEPILATLDAVLQGIITQVSNLMPPGEALLKVETCNPYDDVQQERCLSTKTKGQVDMITSLVYLVNALDAQAESPGVARPDGEVIPRDAKFEPLYRTLAAVQDLDLDQVNYLGTEFNAHQVRHIIVQSLAALRNDCFEAYLDYDGEAGEVTIMLRLNLSMPEPYEMINHQVLESFWADVCFRTAGKFFNEV